MPKQPGNKISKVCCSRLLSVHSANYCHTLFCSPVIKYFVEAVLCPSNAVPGEQLPHLPLPISYATENGSTKMAQGALTLLAQLENSC